MNKIMLTLALSAVAVAGCGDRGAEPQAGGAGPSDKEALASDNRAQRTDARALRALADDVWARILENNIYLRLSEGLPIEKFEDFSLEQFHADKAAAAQFLARLQAIDPGALNADDLITWEILDFELRDDGATDDDYWLIFNITAYQAPYQIRFAQQALAAQAIDDRAAADHYLHLVLELADMIDQFGAKVEQQAERGIYLPRPALPSTRASWQGMRVEIPDAISVAEERLEYLTETQRTDFQLALQGLLEGRVIGGLDRLLAMIGEDYEAAAPEAVGLAQYPGGVEVYQRRIRRETTLELSVEEIHRRGHDAVSDIASRMQSLREQLGFEGSAREFLDAIRTEPRFIADNPQEVEERFEMYIDRIEPLLDEYFTYRPKASYGVRRLPPTAEAGMTYGYYSSPTEDQPVGYYNYSASNLSERSLVWAGPLIYHELLPGHHFHMATQQENDSLQPFRKNYSATAFTEGWAEYASSLGIEMGLYETPYELYGRYMLEMFLATRLVVDTGMNALGWTLQDAREYMAEHVVQSEAEIATETLRYSTSIPAQALAYRLGYEKIWALRRMAEEVLGQAFDIREFHRVVLADGSKPLGVLESKIQRMIDAHQGESAARARQ